MTSGNFSASSQSSSPLGRTMNQYEVIDVIATGGMGVVYKARHTLTDRIVAIKLLPSELARDVSNVDRLKLEAKALAQLNHPNIVTTFDFGFSSLQEPFIVIEYVDGESLKEILERDVMVSVDRAVPLFVQIVDAMRFAHTNKILHRDLKPHNIMVTNTPQIDHVKVLDFGVAKMIEETQAITRTGEVVGSPLYMSPEQCIGKPYDQRCDIYSVGVVMYETLTGVVPYRGDNYISTVHLKCSKLAPAFKDVVPGRTFPHELEMIVLRCLEVDPDKRFASMLDLKEELEEVLKNLPKAEHPKALAHSREGRDSTVASTSFSLAEEMSRENASAGAAHGTAYGAGAAASQPANSAGQSQPAASSQTRAGASPPTAFPQESGVSSTSGGGVNSEAGISGVSGVHGSTPTVPNEIAWNASWAVSTDGEAPAEPKMDETWDRIPEVPAWDLLGASGSRRTEDLTSTGKRKPPPLPEQSASAGAPVVSARTGAPFPDQSTPPYAMPTAASTDSQASAPDMVPPANAQSQMSQDDANLSPPAVQTSRGARKSEPQPW